MRQPRPNALGFPSAGPSVLVKVPVFIHPATGLPVLSETERSADVADATAREFLRACLVAAFGDTERHVSPLHAVLDLLARFGTCAGRRVGVHAVDLGDLETVLRRPCKVLPVLASRGPRGFGAEFMEQLRVQKSL